MRRDQHRIFVEIGTVHKTPKSLQKILKKKEKIVVHRVLHLFSGSQTLDEGGGRKGLRYCGIGLFLVRCCGNFYFKLRYCGFQSPSGLR